MCFVHMFLKHKHDISQQIISEFETIARRSVFVRFPKEYHVIALPDSNSDGHADIADTSTRPAGQVHDSSRGGQCLKNHQVWTVIPSSSLSRNQTDWKASIYSYAELRMVVVVT